MEKISTVVDGKLMSVPVLKAEHLAAISHVHSGKRPCCAPDILRDLIDAGLVEDTNDTN